MIETALDEEMTEHLGYDRHDPTGRGSGNSRNGTRVKTVLTDNVGPVSIEVPRNRDGSFDPVIVKQAPTSPGWGGHDRVVTGRQGPDHRRDLSAFRGDLRRLTVEGHHLKDHRPGAGRDGRVDGPAVGEGLRRASGPGPAAGSQRSSGCRSSPSCRNRGVEDVFFIICDGLKGLPDSVGAAFPQAVVQTCVIHLIRNTFKYASKKYWQQIAADLKPIYRAPTREQAWAAFEEFEEKWGKPYPAISQLWRNAWEQFTPFLDYDPEIRTVLCSTNAIESLNARYRRAVTVRGHFPTEQAAMKCLYLVTRSLDPKGTGQTRWTMRWKPALNAFAITFGDPGLAHGKYPNFIRCRPLRWAYLEGTPFSVVAASGTGVPPAIRPVTVHDKLAVEVLNLLERHRIDDLVVIDDDNVPVGIVDSQDLTRLKLL